MYKGKKYKVVREAHKRIILKTDTGLLIVGYKTLRQRRFR